MAAVGGDEQADVGRTRLCAAFEQRAQDAALRRRFNAEVVEEQREGAGDAGEAGEELRQRVERRDLDQRDGAALGLHGADRGLDQGGLARAARAPQQHVLRRGAGRKAA